MRQVRTRTTRSPMRWRTATRSWLRVHWPRLAELIPIAILLFIISAITVNVWHLPNGDVDEYYGYALDFWTRFPLFHALPVEYPPLAILPFTLTLIPPLPDYHALYGWWMGLFLLLGYLAFLRYSNRRRAITYVVYLTVGATATVLARFDLVPALVTLAALWTTERQRFGYAYLLLAVGILLKLYPAFLLPVVMIAHYTALVRAGESPLPRWEGDARAWLATTYENRALRRVAGGTALCLGITALVFIGALAVAGISALSGFSYAGDRPLQVESTPATLLWLGTLFGIPAHPEYSFQSLNYVGVLDTFLKPASALALIGGCLWAYWRQWRGRLGAGQAYLACLCAVIVTNKIFSPQYLIWVLPVVAAIDGFDVLWLGVCVLTTLDYPILYQMRHPIWTVPFTWEFMPVLAARNLLLLYVTVRAILRPRAAPQPAATLDRDAAHVANAAIERDPEPLALR